MHLAITRNSSRSYSTSGYLNGTHLEELPLLLPDKRVASKDQRVLIVEAWNATPHLETGLEIALRLALSGHAVAYFHIGHCLPYVEYFNKTGNSIQSKLFLNFESPQSKGIKILHSAAICLGIDINATSSKRPWRALKYRLPTETLASFDSLMNYAPANYPGLGISVASSLASILKNSVVCPADFTELCNALASSYRIAFEITNRLIRAFNANNVIVFNGRFSCTKGICDAANSNHLSLYYHERGSSKERFSLSTFQPHDRIALQQTILETWRRSEHSDTAVTSASQYYIDKINGLDRDWTSYTSNQKKGLATALLGNKKLSSKTGKAIVYFSSSDDEFIACADAWKPDQFDWSSQIEALQVLSQIAADQGHALVVRVHPHLSFKDDRERQAWDTLAFISDKLRDNISIVSCFSPISSYELLHEADVVVTYGSTIGIEAVYWHRPSILLGNSEYDFCCDSVYQPRTRSQLADLLSRTDSLMVSRVSSYPYGYYKASHGIDFKLYQAQNLFSGLFMGEDLHACRRTTFHNTGSKLKRILRLLTS